MTKIERLQWENKKMKETLEKIHAMCNMTNEEQEEYLKTFEYEGAQFYPIAVGSINYMAQEALTAVKIGKEMRRT